MMMGLRRLHLYLEIRQMLTLLKVRTLAAAALDAKNSS